MLSFRVLVWATAASATALLDRNLAYRSPFGDHPQFSHDTWSIHARYVHHTRRQVEDASGLVDEHYPTFYGTDFGNSPFIWSSGLNFTHSVASGDPLNTSVLLWTRAEPLSEPSTNQSPESVPVCLSWAIFDNEALIGSPVDAGQAFTSYDADFTLRVEAAGLQPDAVYRFHLADCTDLNNTNPLGRARTISSPHTPADQVNGGKNLTLAVFSCSQYQSGWFNAYGIAAYNTLADTFAHLGDYDDHEVAGQSWKAGTVDSNDSHVGCTFSPSGTCFTDRKLAAVRAYHEWVPVCQVSADNKLRIWRNFQISKLLDLTMLDTRQYDRDLTDLYYNTQYINTISSFANRSLTRPEQEAWLQNTFDQSQARGAVWRIIGSSSHNSTSLGGLISTHGTAIARTALAFLTISNRTTSRTRSSSPATRTPTGSPTSPICPSLPPPAHHRSPSSYTDPNDTANYDPATGEGALGVEFAGTAVTSTSAFGPGMGPAAADNISTALVAAPGNEQLQ
ncbi:unnamed protein product [Peniophora sp. CBMAI 1063]|nr:unnamed protein product [Peniophora sp. CBMAI 1063]